MILKRLEKGLKQREKRIGPPVPSKERAALSRHCLRGCLARLLLGPLLLGALLLGSLLLGSFLGHDSSSVKGSWRTPSRRPSSFEGHSSAFALSKTGFPRWEACSRLRVSPMFQCSGTIE